MGYKRSESFGAKSWSANLTPDSSQGLLCPSGKLWGGWQKCNWSHFGSIFCGVIDGINNFTLQRLYFLSWQPSLHSKLKCVVSRKPWNFRGQISLASGWTMTMPTTYVSMSINDCNDFCTPPTTPLSASGTVSCINKHVEDYMQVHSTIPSIETDTLKSITMTWKSKWGISRNKPTQALIIDSVLCIIIKPFLWDVNMLHSRDY